VAHRWAGRWIKVNTPLWTPRQTSIPTPRRTPLVRLPRAEDPIPPVRRVAALAAWAAALGLVGFAVAGRAFVGMLLRSDEPGWYQPWLVVDGLAGIGLTAAAFALVNRGRLPWVCLAGATAALVTALVLTAIAL
jgi:hypothetical protein